jgi:type IV secretion system protein VirB6
MAIQVAQKLYDSVDAALQSTLATGMTKVMLGVGALFGTFWLLNFTLRSIFWLQHGMTAAFKEVILEIVKVAFIAGCAWNITWYVHTIVPFVTGLPSWMGGILSGNEGTQINQIDALVTNYIDTLEELIKAMKFTFWKTKFSVIWLSIQAVVLYLFAGVPFLLVAVGTLFITKASVSLMFAVGPLFIAFALFNQTKQWFWSWLSLIAGFMLAQVLFSLVLGLEIGFINSVVLKDGVIDTSLEGNIAMLLYFAAFTVLATELPGYAATVMGGAPVAATGIGGMLMKGTGGSLALNGAKGARFAIDKIKGRGRNNIQ